LKLGVASIWPHPRDNINYKMRAAHINANELMWMYKYRHRYRLYLYCRLKLSIIEVQGLKTSDG
jgi:hypothetical protein